MRKRRNRNFKNRAGEQFGDFSIIDTFSDNRGIQYKLKCNSCDFEKNLFSSNFYNKEGKTCSECRYKKLIGKTVNFLYIESLNQYRDEKKNVLYNTICICGTKKIVTRKFLLHSKLSSCGCLGIDTDSMIAKQKFASYQEGAKRRGYEFKLDFEYFKKLIKTNCYYCNSEPKIVDLTKKSISSKRKNQIIKMNGVDRVDNKLGYLYDNVVPCCYKCNTLKASIDLNMAKKILKFKDYSKKYLSVVEIPQNSSYKYEENKLSGTLKLDRVLNQKCPENYGYLTKTLSEDNDPLDIFILSEEKMEPLSCVEIEIIGVFKCIDNGIPDDKIISVIKNSELTENLILTKIDQIKQYLETYKSGFTVLKYLDKDEAEKIYESSRL